MRKIIPMLMFLAVAGAVGAQAATFSLDVAHSSVGFKVKHMMVSNVRGSFADFSGSFVWVPDQPQQWSVEATVQLASVDTGNEKRDEHLRSADFLDVEQFPTMTFKSTKVIPGPDGNYVLHGDLTLRGVTRPIVLDLEFAGKVADPWGNIRVGFTASGVINRQDFGVSWSKAMDNGGVVVSDEVRLELEAEGIEQK